MALFGKLFGEHKEKKKQELPEKEISCMIAVPENEEAAKSFDKLVERLQRSALIDLKESKIGDDLRLKIAVKDLEYIVVISRTKLVIPEMFRIQHLFRDIDINAIQERQEGLMVEMMFNENILESYHIQLKLISEMLDGCLAVLDASSEKVLSGRWVQLAAQSSVPPSPRYIFTVQAVSGETDDVWLHSHGLNRCGLPELEILNSTKDTYNDHYNIIETMAKRLIERTEPLQEKEPVYLAMVTNEIPLMATMVNWKEALKKYPSGILGSAADRKDGHNQYTNAIFCYLSPKDMDKKQYSKVSVFDEYLKENPIFMLSSQETERMKMLAAERLEYMLKMFGRENITILLKVGLEVDEEFKEEGNSFEHIWFELKEKHEDTFTAELTQEPYYVKALHEGAVLDFPYSQITDWIIFSQEGRVTPDDVYLLAYDGWNLE